MILRPFLHTDPIGEIAPNLAAAEDTGTRTRYIIDTHIHADHRCASHALSRATGHTPEHISPLVTDRTRSDEPWFAPTRHTVMVGDLGRTELATTAEEGARALFGSLQRLKALPDYVEVLPGAYAGAVCGRQLSGKPTSTIGFERRHNAAFGIGDEDDFPRFMPSDIPAPPPQAAVFRAINSGIAATAA